jgi:hypothetical protein
LKSIVMSARVIGDRAQHVLVGDAQHLHLDRRDHPAFHFLGRHARRLQDDLDLRGTDVRKRIDRQVDERPRPRACQHQRQPDHHEAQRQRFFDQPPQHRLTAPPT